MTIRNLLVLVVAAAAVVFFAANRSALGFPFYNDDFLFLERARDRPFLSLWGTGHLEFHYWRPWSRELHFWTLRHLFGANAFAFHVANLALWLGVLVAFAAYAARLGGVRIAAAATAIAAALTAWAAPLVWVSGAQELWMLLFALLALHASGAGRTAWAAIAFAGALLSKETALAVPAIAAAQELVIARRGIGAALRRTAPLWVLAAVWALAHPTLGGRLYGVPVPEQLHIGYRPPGSTALASTLLAAFNLDVTPAPDAGWLPAILHALPAALALAALVLVPAQLAAPRESGRATPGRVAALGIVWALLGWSPLLMPTLGWHPYYALFGTLGVALALGAALARAPLVAAALVIALAVLHAGRAGTVSLDMESEAFRARAVVFHHALKADLESQHPSFPRGSRIFFRNVPAYVGFLASEAMVLRTWYGDPTLRGGYFSQYRARAAGDTAGRDYFFRFDPVGRWVETHAGPESLAAARATNEEWEEDHRELALTMGRGGDWSGCARELEMLAKSAPESAEYAYNAAGCHERAGHLARAALWYKRAAALPSATAEMKAVANAWAGRAVAREDSVGETASIR